MPTVRSASRFAFLVSVFGAFVGAQDEAKQSSPPPPRYSWKTGDKYWFEIERGVEAPKSTDPTQYQGKSFLRFVVELNIGKARPKGQGFDATYTIRRIVTETDALVTNEKYTYDSDKGDKPKDLRISLYPDGLVDLLGKPFPLWIDDRGAIHDLKPPKDARNKDVQRLLGTGESELATGLFGLCVPSLPEKQPSGDETWTTKVDMSMSKEEVLEFEVANRLSKKEDGSAVVEQEFKPKKAEAAKLELLEGKGSGGSNKEGKLLDRKLDLSIKGSLSMMGAIFEGAMNVKVATAPQWTPPKKRK